MWLPIQVANQTSTTNDGSIVGHEGMAVLLVVSLEIEDPPFIAGLPTPIWCFFFASRLGTAREKLDHRQLCGPIQRPPRKVGECNRGWIHSRKFMELDHFLTTSSQLMTGGWQHPFCNDSHAAAVCMLGYSDLRKPIGHFLAMIGQEFNHSSAMIRHH